MKNDRFKLSTNLSIKYFSFVFMLLLFIIGFQINRNGIEVKKQQFEDTAGEIVVIFDTDISDEQLNHMVSSLNTSVGIKKHIDNYALLYVMEELGYQKALTELKKQDLVKIAEENYEITIMGASRDPYSDAQWAIHNPGRYLYLSEAGIGEKVSAEGIDLDVVDAWSVYHNKIYDREVLVALLDTGVDYTHPDLADHMWINPNEIEEDGVDNDGNGYVDDIYGWDFYNNDSSICHYKFNKELNTNLASPDDNDDHGTHIAGIIAATANNNIGIAGVASNVNVKIMSLKINGGPKGTGNIAAAIEAIKYATMMGADICNMSWGTSQKSEALEQIIRDSDMLFVAAAGNTGANNNKTPIYPANLRLDNLISVTFINSRGDLTKISNYGSKTVDIAAPGEDIFSTVVGNYAYMSGSSMAAPHVTSIAAMLYAYSDNLYPANVKDIILSSIKPLSTVIGSVINPGIPSAYQAVMNANMLETDVDVPTIKLSTVYTKDKILIPIKVSDKGGSGVRVIRWLYGERKLEDFHRGMEGTHVADNQISVTKTGIYTFYASDYAGNETIKTYKVKDDVTKPTISASYTVKNDYKSRTVTVKVTDTQSGIKRVKYMKGKKKTADFLPAGAGTELILKDGMANFQAKSDGVYTIFASDYRGNITVSSIEVKTIKATEMKFLHSYKTIHPNETYTLRAFVKPFNTTDQITYTSSNKEVATISKTGKVKALKEGSSYITARTSSGVTAVCKIIVKK